MASRPRKVINIAALRNLQKLSRYSPLKYKASLVDELVEVFRFNEAATASVTEKVNLGYELN